jgi:TolA-binding protein
LCAEGGSVYFFLCVSRVYNRKKERGMFRHASATGDLTNEYNTPVLRFKEKVEMKLQNLDRQLAQLNKKKEDLAKVYQTIQRDAEHWLKPHEANEFRRQVDLHRNGRLNGWGVIHAYPDILNHAKSDPDIRRRVKEWNEENDKIQESYEKIFNEKNRLLRHSYKYQNNQNAITRYMSRNQLYRAKLPNGLGNLVNSFGRLRKANLNARGKLKVFRGQTQKNNRNNKKPRR